MSQIHYRNPVISGCHPDPSVCRVGRDYYLAASSFEYFPGVPIFHSRDLVHWTLIGHCLTRDSQLPLDGAASSSGIYAPTLRHHDGRFYMITTNCAHGGNLYVWADDPAGPWSEPIPVAMGGIDPSLTFAPDGRVFVHSAQHVLHEIDIATGALRGEGRPIWSGTGAQAPESPHLYSIGSWWYLLLAEGGTEYGHMATVARSRDPYGPYEPCPHNPILSHRSRCSPIQATGHGDLVEDHEGRWWIVFLGVRPQGYPPMHHLGRETFLAPVTWSDDGWPIVNGGALVELEMEVDGPASVPVPEPPVRDDFDGETLGLVWNFRRNPVPGSWSLADSRLTLQCLAASPFERVGSAFIGRRQQHIDCRAETCVDFDPQSEAEEAGLTVLMNEAHHVDLFIARRGGRRVAVLRRTVGSLRCEVAERAVEAGRVRLCVEADGEAYRFAVQSGDGERMPLGAAETRHLSAELACTFTGVYIGLYATANGTASRREACFDWFDYEGLSPAGQAR